MKFDDEDFIPYCFPYEHNYRNYGQFLISHDIDLKKNNYYIYLISNPFQYNYKKTSNDYSISVAILVKNKLTKKLSFKIQNFDFKSILQLNIFAKINSVGDISFFENFNETFEKKIYETKININDSTDCEVLSLEEIVDKFGILKKERIYELDHFKDLEFYLYTINNRKILIPAIEVLKYFYLYNYAYQKEPKSHFCQDILTPNGILNSLNVNKYDSVKNHYDIEINGNYSIDDRYKILFFLTNPKRLYLYSNIYNIYKKSNVISARLPRKKLLLNSRVFEYKKQNLLLVLNIITHDLNNDFLSDFSCNYSHAKSQFKEKEEGKRDSSKDCKVNIRKNNSLSVNDQLYGNNQLEFDEETDSDFKLNINCQKASEPITLNAKKIVDTQREQQGGYKQKDYTNLKETPSTTKNNNGNTDEAVFTKQKYDEEEKEKSKNNLNIIEILNHLKKNSDFLYLGEKVFKFPKVLDHKGKSLKRAFMFLDKKNQIKRKYFVAKLQYKSIKDIYLIELQARANGEQKSFLVIIKNTETIESINNKFISKELIDMAINGNRSWFATGLLLKNNEYIIFTHRNKIESIEERIITKIN
ncbi:hypothetical protein AMRN_2134 [Malaciobacter marinus]|uniref:Uncharacterized protein n=1 Tax=Malaciobacter marinus TaxID=505249 RepID=A0A347TMM0_9BACT|nr:hypothetical protein [Malaciobacter marinus]AXX87848.1 hypothetical protein AMRN_2134 [Malaciobacter marinus]PHO16132.1 hypothetical protein CPH92_03250 [Malaciobacter marinus]